MSSQQADGSHAHVHANASNEAEAEADPLSAAAALASDDDAQQDEAAANDRRLDARLARREAAAQGAKKKRNWRTGGGNKTSGEKPPRLRKHPRAAALLAWLVRTFDLDRHGGGYACMNCAALRGDGSIDGPPPSSFHVVDVAGGRGTAAFYLAAFHSISVSIVDPAHAGLKRWEQHFAENQDRIKKKRQTEEEVNGNASADSCPVCLRPLPAASSSSVVPLASPSPSGIVRPVSWLPNLRHFRCLFPSSIGLSLHKAHQRPAAASAQRLNDDEAEEEEEEAGCGECDADTQCTPLESSNSRSDALAAALDSTLLSCSLLYGLHADGATEALVDYALRHDKNFAVVPCCVFPNTAPHRRVSHAQMQRLRDMLGEDIVLEQSSAASSSSTASEDPRPVRLYDEFLAYLLAKHPSIRVARLPFEGRNIVVYRRVQPEE